MLENDPKPQSRQRPARRKLEPRQIASLVIFGLLVLLGPLAFGAVDRIVQAGLVLLLAVGVAVAPPARVVFSPRGRILVITLLALLLVKEFAPRLFFGGARWRREAELLGLSFPWSHHPEPARAFDWMLVFLVALVWLQWVRTLAADRTARIAMTWVIFLAGVVVAVVCFAMKVSPEKGGAIFGLRPAQGWTGWGPFPNRNHTASLLAMAGLAGAGCLAWAIAKRRNLPVLAGVLGFLLIFAALLAGQSRGGLLGLGAGLAIFSVLLLLKYRDQRTMAGIVAGLLVVVMGLAAFGTQVLGRFKSEETAQMSNHLRIAIWGNALTMWKDAPLLGHGAETFTGLFPFYQNLKLDDNVVLHPESSWLLWLTELGAVPVILIGLAFALLVSAGLRGTFKLRSSFSLGAGAFAGVGAILVHGLIDVPAHRWGTAGYALALLGLACPVAVGSGVIRLVSPRLVLVPLAVGLFWVLPFLGRGPAWQPVTPELLRGRELSGGGRRPALGEWQRALGYFPLARDLHHFAALRELEAGKPIGAEWQKHIEIVHRLAPGGWRYPITHAKAVKRFSPALCIEYWQIAIDRSDWRGFEILGDAVRDTSGLPRAGDLWADYVAANPKFGLTYAKLLPGEEGRPFFETWWEGRARVDEVSDDEARNFYVFAPNWATGEQLEEWIRRQSRRRREDYRTWMSLLHGVGRDERAWRVYEGIVPDPPYPPRTNQSTIRELETQMHLSPENPTHVVALAQAIEADGDADGARAMVVEAANKKNAPSWFLRKGAYLLATEGKFSEAVEMALREK